MTKRETEIERRRAELLARSAQLREDIARTGASVTGRLGGAERGIKVAKALTSTPVLWAAGVALLAYAGPARAVQLIGRGMVGVNLLRKVVAAFGPTGRSGDAVRRDPPVSGQ